jgi:diguanylate cyclase (GGDEF)-like protein
MMAAEALMPSSRSRRQWGHQRLLADRGIRTKFLLVFGVAALAAMLVGWSGLAAVVRTNDSTDRLYQVSVARIQLAGKIRVSAVRGLNDLQSFAMAPDSTSALAAETLVLADDDELDTALADYRAMGLDGRRAAIYSSVTTALQAYRDVRDDRLFPLARANRTVDFQQVYRHTAAQLVAIMISAVDDLVAIEDAEAAAVFRQAQATYRTSRASVALFLVIGLAAAGGLGLAAARLIIGPLRAVGQVLAAVAGGDLTHRVEVTGRDEVGRMAEALNQAIGSMRTTVDTMRESSAREGVLATTGRQLLAVTDISRVRAIGSAALVELIAVSPDVVVAVAVPRGESATVVASAGFSREAVGTEVPLELVTDLAIRPIQDVDSPPAPLADLAPDTRYWRGAVVTGKDVDRYLIVGGSRPIPDSVFDAVLNLSHQVSLAEASCMSNAELTHRANHDHLTGLPTRSLLFRQLSEAVDGGADGIALLNIDLDDFKQVNDVHGHGAGDELLVEVARRLTEAGTSNGVPARFGGDEFALLLVNAGDESDVLRIAEDVCARIVEPIRLRAGYVSVGASIGVTLAEPGLTAGDLVRCADIAMYSAKAGGKNRVVRFNAEQHGAIARFRVLEEHVGEAVSRCEIEVRYRPMVDLRTGQLVGVEAIGYWQHPTEGLLTPADFLPIAQQTGDIGPIERYVLDTACIEVARWSDESTVNDLSLNVSIAERHLLSADFPNTIRTLLGDTGLAADRLTIQVAEFDGLHERLAQERLAVVADLGVRIAVANFGSASGSLIELTSLPIHQIIVDRRTLASTSGSLVELILSVGQILGLETVCTDEIQPMDANELLNWLSAATAHAGL